MPDLLKVNAANSPFFDYWNKLPEKSPETEAKILKDLDVLKNVQRGDHLFFKKDGTIVNYGHIQAKLLKSPAQLFKQLGRNFKFYFQSVFNKANLTLNGKVTHLENVYGLFKSVDKYCSQYAFDRENHQELIRSLFYVKQHFDKNIIQDKKWEKIAYSDHRNLREELLVKIDKIIQHEISTYKQLHEQEDTPEMTLVNAVWRERDQEHSKQTEYQAFSTAWDNMNQTERAGVSFNSGRYVLADVYSEIESFLSPSINLHSDTKGTERQNDLKREIAYLFTKADPKLNPTTERTALRGGVESLENMIEQEEPKDPYSVVEERIAKLREEIADIQASPHLPRTKKIKIEQAVERLFPHFIRSESKRRMERVKKYGELSPEAAKFLRRMKLGATGTGGALLAVVACIAPVTLSYFFAEKSFTVFKNMLTGSDGSDDLAVQKRAAALAEMFGNAVDGKDSREVSSLLGKKGVQAIEEGVNRVTSHDIVNYLAERKIEANPEEVENALRWINDVLIHKQRGSSTENI